MTQPPDYIIEAARCAAIDSPCAKSKRGVVVFDPVTAAYQQKAGSPFRIRDVIVGAAPNSQPAGFACTGSDACRRDCGKLCVHAEQRAILQAVRHCGDDNVDRLAYLELVHVKVVDGVVVPGGGPSCWQCSRLVVEVGLRGVWLYEYDESHPASAAIHAKGAWRFYEAADFHRETLRACGIGDQACR